MIPAPVFNSKGDSFRAWSRRFWGHADSHNSDACSRGGGCEIDFRAVGPEYEAIEAACTGNQLEDMDVGLE